MEFDGLLDFSPYSLDKIEKRKLLTTRLTELTEHHRKHCPKYNAILKSISYNKEMADTYADLPFLPVRLFKELTLKSVPQDAVVKTMTSSGTSGQDTSKIYLDKTTSSNQQKAMVKIVSEFTGSVRMPMIIIDCPSVVKDRKMFSARGAGILGFSIFGSKRVYALDDDMHLDLNRLKSFINEHKNKKILLFGFTFMIWKYFYKELERIKAETGETLDLSNAMMIHGGGWKKLFNEAVDSEEFHQRLKNVCGLDSIHDYYGMVEQTGCIYMQCEHGHLHASIFSDVIIRRPEDFSEADIGERGIIQVVSTIPESYPGHSLLTEDEGIILGEDDCPCGRKGKYFRIFGRIKNAEIRGCSDTYGVGSQISQRASSLIDIISAPSQDHICEDILSERQSKVWDRTRFLVGNSRILDTMVSVVPKQPFSNDVVRFLSDLSKEFMQNTVAKAHPDLTTLGFWIRKGAIAELRKRFTFNDGTVRLGRGMAFHIAPSNVPVNFAYSLFTGLLTGNANVVRVPSKKFPQVEIIAEAINKVLEAHSEIKPYICLLRYDRSSSDTCEINETLSAMCDTRIIWGGDATIASLRKFPLSARAAEITFADRYSLAVIDSDIYMRTILDPIGGCTAEGYDHKQASRIASAFYNDTYLSDQNACTSPRAVVWTGSAKDKAKKIFWKELYDIVMEKYPFQPIMGVDKLTTGYMAAAYKTRGKCGKMDRNGAVDGYGVKILPYKNNRLIRVTVDKLDADLMDYRGNCGYFYEYDCHDIKEIYDFCNNVHCQTVGVIGKKNMFKPLFSMGLKGIDRIVPIGHTMDFDLIWDGYDLVERLTRVIRI